MASDGLPYQVRAKLGSFPIYKEWTPGTPIPHDLVTEIQAKLDAIQHTGEGRAVPNTALVEGRVVPNTALEEGRAVPNTALVAAPAGKPRPISLGAVLGATFLGGAQHGATGAKSDGAQHGGAQHGATFLGAASTKSGAFTARAVLSTVGAGSSAQHGASPSAQHGASSSALGATSPSANTAMTVPPVPSAVHLVPWDTKATTGTKVTTGTKATPGTKVTTGTKGPSAPAKDDASRPPPPYAPQTALFESALHEAQGASRGEPGISRGISRGEPGIGGPAPVVMPRLDVDLVGSVLQEADIANFYAEFEAELEA
jgi:hypothetical protein